MNVYVLVILALFHVGEEEQPLVASKIYSDKFSCQQAEAAIATELEKDKTVLGYTFPIECQVKSTGQKV